MTDFSVLTALASQLVAEGKRSILLNLTEAFLETFYETGYHFSDILTALADYTARESERAGHHETQPTWKTVSMLLQAAVKEAEREDRELP